MNGNKLDDNRINTARAFDEGRNVQSCACVKTNEIDRAARAAARLQCGAGMVGVSASVGAASSSTLASNRRPKHKVGY
ncbi:hypothetical protein EVAR_16170_1 [Eumeta japonica]|uniref:Uncharacterized protein n=1 Tax=Eumeta variegata TaxID=151549 RepID=A0A4C1WBR5_EUMVA|nr:hypothetical protein EVAR_16170_1 [Eumeta japonica]